MSRWRTRQRDHDARRVRTAARQPGTVTAATTDGVGSTQWGVVAPARMAGDLPVWSWRCAPDHLITRRQMREAGLAPGRAEPVGLIECRRGRRWAHLWDRDQLRPKRTPTPAQLAALDKAMAARRWCDSCASDVGYCVPTSLGRCIDCAYPDSVDTRTTSANRDDPGPVSRDGPVTTTSATTRPDCRITPTHQTEGHHDMASDDITNWAVSGATDGAERGEITTTKSGDPVESSTGSEVPELGSPGFLSRALAELVADFEAEQARAAEVSARVDDVGLAEAVGKAGEAVYHLHRHRPDVSGMKHWHSEQARISELGEPDERDPAMSDRDEGLR